MPVGPVPEHGLMLGFIGNIGMSILLGIIKLPRLKMLWHNNNGYIENPKIMSRNRFAQFFVCYVWLTAHMTSNFTNLDILQSYWQHSFNHPTCHTNKVIIPFKGKVLFKHYTKGKHAKWGITVLFIISDANNGYIYKLQIYTGKDMESKTIHGL